jgi:type II secretory pathway component PulM
MTNQTESDSRPLTRTIDLFPRALRQALVRAYVTLNRPLFQQIENLRTEVGTLRTQNDRQIQDLARRVEAIEQRLSGTMTAAGDAISDAAARQMVAAIEGRIDALAARVERIARVVPSGIARANGGMTAQDAAAPDSWTALVARIEQLEATLDMRGAVIDQIAYRLNQSQRVITDEIVALRAREVAGTSGK